MTSTFGHASKCWCLPFHAALFPWNIHPNLYPHPCSAPVRHVRMNRASTQHLGNGDVEPFLLTSALYCKRWKRKCQKGGMLCKGGNSRQKCFQFLLSINICTTYVLSVLYRLNVMASSKGSWELLLSRDAEYSLLEIHDPLHYSSLERRNAYLTL